MAPTSSATTTTRAALPRLTFHAVRMPGTMVGTIRKRNSVQRLGRNAMVISNRSFDIERKASRIWKVKAGSVVITIMNSTRNSMP